MIVTKTLITVKEVGDDDDGLFGGENDLEDVAIDGDSVGQEEEDSDQGPMEGSWEKEEDLLGDEKSMGSGEGEEDSDVYGGEYGSEEEEDEPAFKSKKGNKKEKDPMGDFASYDDFAEMLEADDIETNE